MRFSDTFARRQKWCCDCATKMPMNSRLTALSVERPGILRPALLRHRVLTGEEIVAVTLPAVSNCVLRWAQAIVNAGTRNKWVRFPRTEELPSVWTSTRRDRMR
ncbi:hypothetical protein MRX96_055249 [Rhipicephalus microplus]